MAKKSWVYVYCDKCGFITTEDPYNSNSEKICTVCKNILKRVPKKYHTKSTKYEFMYSNEFEILIMGLSQMYWSTAIDADI